MSQNLQIQQINKNALKLIDEAKEVVKSDSCLYLKDFSTNLPITESTKKYSILLSGDNHFRIYLFKSNNTGDAAISLKNSSGKETGYIVKAPQNVQYSNINIIPKTTSVYSLEFSYQSGNAENLVGILALKDVKTGNKTGMEDNSSEVFTQVDEMPQFIKDDNMAFAKWVMQNLKYPEGAKKAGIGGKAFVEFVVDKTGKVKNAKIIKGINNEIDEAIINTINRSPIWQKPGVLKGKKVDVVFTLPINLVLK